MTRENESDNTDYRIWVDMTAKPFEESPARWAIVAQFRYLLEAIDYAGQIATELVITGPSGMASHYPKIGSAEL